MIGANLLVTRVTNSLKFIDMYKEEKGEENGNDGLILARVVLFIINSVGCKLHLTDQSST
jgi:hypothetical protein